MDELEQSYRILGLEPGASVEEVNQAYKDLVFVWHPDRIPKDNPRLQQKAEEKLKEINHARDKLRSARREGKTQKSQSQSKKSQEPSRSYYSRRETQNSSQSYSKR